MAQASGLRQQARAARVAALQQVPDAFFATLRTTRAAFGDFVLKLDGRVVTPNDVGYDADRQESNPAFQEYPYVIAYCASWNDVYTCLQWAQGLGRPFVCRSGGHSTSGYSVMSDRLVIDVSGLNAVDVAPDRATVRVGAGCAFETFNKALDAYGLHVPGGICPDVCVAGYMQGGGFGFTSRQFGMNCDVVVAARVMLADGAVVTASAEQNAPLFWALRGGTGGNFGVLLDVTYRAVPLGPVWGYGIAWDLADAPQVLVALQQGYMRHGASPQLGYMVAIGRNESETGPGALMVRSLYTGTRADGLAQLAPLMAVGRPHVQFDQTGSYLNIHEAVVASGTVPVPMPPEGVKEVKQGGYIARPLGVADWQKVVDYHARMAQLPYGLTSVEPYGGAIGAVPPLKTAFIHRDVDMNFFVDSFWRADADQPKAVAWLDGFMALMQPYFNGHCYQNYPRRDLPNFAWRYWGDAYPALQQIKAKYDPANVFSFPQAIVPSASAALPAGVPPEVARGIGEPVVYDVPPRITR